MAKHKDDGEAYLEMYPNLAKRWINECMLCHHQGYKPEMMEAMDGERTAAKNHLMRYFDPMEVDEMGICEHCARRTKTI